MPTPLQLEYRPRGPLRQRLKDTALGVLRIVMTRRFWSIVFSTIAIVSVLGFLSNRLSYARCERRTAIQIVTTDLGRVPVHISPSHDAESRPIFTAAGIGILPTPPPGTRTYPYAYVSRARSAGPFFVDVEYAYTPAPLGGAGGVHRYLCLFGYVIQIRDQLTWIS